MHRLHYASSAAIVASDCLTTRILPTINLFSCCSISIAASRSLSALLLSREQQVNPASHVHLEMSCNGIRSHVLPASKHPCITY